MDPSAVSLRPAIEYTLPSELRDELKGDFGPVLQTHELAQAIGDAEVAAVGDRVSVTLKRLGIRPRLFVCDFHTQRGDLSAEFKEHLGNWGSPLRVINPAGKLTAQAWDACVTAAGRKGFTRVEVDGEEDLLALPLFLAMPLGSKVLYGVPNQGVGVVTVDDALRERVRGIIGRMAVG